MRNEERLARALGWFSIGLGLPQLAAPQMVARLIGVGGDGDSRALMRLVGLRELACGVNILRRQRPVPWLWSRVAGDAMDLALLSGALSSAYTRRNRVAAAMLAVAGVTALDLRCSAQLRRRATRWDVVRRIARRA